MSAQPAAEMAETRHGFLYLLGVFIAGFGRTYSTGGFNTEFLGGCENDGEGNSED